jgi:hypothetical protein
MESAAAAKSWGALALGFLLLTEFMEKRFGVAIRLRQAFENEGARGL